MVVRHDGHPYSRAANKHPPVVFPSADRSCHLFRDSRVIGGVAAENAHILYLVFTRLQQVSLTELFEVIASVI